MCEELISNVQVFLNHPVYIYKVRITKKQGIFLARIERRKSIAIIMMTKDEGKRRMMKRDKNFNI